MGCQSAVPPRAQLLMWPTSDATGRSGASGCGAGGASARSALEVVNARGVLLVKARLARSGLSSAVLVGARAKARFLAGAKAMAGAEAIVVHTLVVLLDVLLGLVLDG